MCQHALGRPAEDELPKARPTVGSHDDQVDFVDLRLLMEDLANRSASGVDFVDDDIDATQSQMPRELRARLFGVDRLSNYDLARPCWASSSWPLNLLAVPE